MIVGIQGKKKKILHIISTWGSTDCWNSVIMSHDVTRCYTMSHDVTFSKWEKLCHRTQELCESRGGRPGLPVPDSPYGLCGT